MEKTLQTQITKIKNIIVSLLTYQEDRLTLREGALIEKVYELMDDILCDRIHHKHYTTEEFIDSAFMENAMVMKRTKNTEVKKLVKLLEEGIKW